MSDANPWQPVRIQLVVTGRGEAKCAANLVGKVIHAAGRAIHPLEAVAADQRPRKQIRNISKLLPAQAGRQVPTKRHLEVIRELGKRLADPAVICILIDDLEKGERQAAAAHFEYYRRMLDDIPAKNAAARSSVHFLVNMLEAYFFHDVEATNQVIEGLELGRHDGDVEDISHPKNALENEIKQRIGRDRGYRETDDAVKIVRHLNLETVLADPDQCRSLRTLVAWCWEQIGQERTDQFQLKGGAYWDVTASQLRERPARVEPLGVETSYQPVSC